MGFEPNRKEAPLTVAEQNGEGQDLGEACELTYLSAAGEIDQILTEIEGENELDIDDLAGKVERAAQLILFCNDRLKRAETRVRRVAQDLSLESEEENIS